MAACQALLQKWVAFLVSTVFSLVVAAVAWLRVRFATALTPLNHILMSGFFFVHWFVIGVVS
jgi:hypothetical protein